MKTHLDRALRAGLYLALLTPLLYAQGFVQPLLTLKVFVFQGLIEIVFALWLALAIFHPEYRPRRNPILLALLALLALGGISAALGPDLARSLWSHQARALGLIAAFHFFLYFLALSSTPRFDFKKYFTASFIIAAAMALFAMVETQAPGIFFNQMVSGGRPGSFLGNPSFLAGYLLFHIFWGFWLGVSLREGRNVPLMAAWAGAELLMLVALFLTETRAALIALALGLLTAAIFLARTKSERLYGLSGRTVRRAAIGTLAAVVLFTGLFWATREAALWRKVPGLARATELSLASFDIQPRLIALGIAWDSFKERPWLGWGPENFKYPFDRRYDPKLLRAGFGETYFDKPHNIVAEHLVTGGILGTAAYLAVLLAAGWIIFRRAPEDARPFFFAALVAYLVQALFLFETFGTYLALFAMLAWLAALHGHRPEGAPSRFVPPLRYAPWVTGGLVLAALTVLGSTNVRILYANHKQYWGLNYLINLRPEESIESFRAALRTWNPYRDQVRVDFTSSIGQAYAQGVVLPDVNGIAQETLLELRKTIAAHPNDYYPRVAFAEATADLASANPSLVVSGMAEIREAMKANPRRQQPYYTLARLYTVQGDRRSALLTMKTAVDLDPEAGDPHFYYGLTAFGAGEVALGFQEIERAAQLGREPRSAAEARILANFLADAERYEEAAKWYRAALRREPSDLDVQIKLGIVDYYIGERDEARLVLEDAAKRVDLTQTVYADVLREIFADLGLAL